MLDAIRAEISKIGSSIDDTTGNRIVAKLDSLRTTIQQLNSTVHDAAEAQKQEQEPPILRAELQVPETIERRRSERDDRHYRVQVWLAIATTLAFVAAAAYAGIAVVQWYAILEGNSLTDQAMKNARRANARAIDTARTANIIAQQANTATKEIGESANQITRDALTEVQRAFISADTDQATVTESGKGNDVAFRFKLTNSGSTPTKAMRAHISFLWIPLELPDNFTFPDLWRTGKPHIDVPVAVGPKGSIGLATEPISMSIVEDTEDHKFHMYFWGWAIYRDVFKETPVHLTEFCYELIPSTKVITSAPAGTKTLALIWNNCARYNCYDKDCEDYTQRVK